MANAAKVKQLLVQCPNRIGLLADVAGVLAAAKINMLAACCYGMGEQATFMIVVEKHSEAKKTLKKAGYSVAEDSVIRLDLSNKPGELARAATTVAEAGVNMDYAYATAAGRSAIVIIKSQDDAKALRALRR